MKKNIDIKFGNGLHGCRVTSFVYSEYETIKITYEIGTTVRTIFMSTYEACELGLINLEKLRSYLK